MAKFNVATARPATSSPVTTEATPTATTHERAPGFARSAQSELFLLAVANMVGEDTFYESAGDRDSRYVTLIHELARTEPAWTIDLLGWLRGEANMRSAALVGAAEFVAARRGMEDHEQHGPRAVDAVLQRADEPGEVLAYWTGRYGMALPKGLKRGVASAVLRLYNEYAYAKYDRTGSAFRFARVLDLVHPSTDVEWQRALFAYAHGDMRGREQEIPDLLTMLRARAEILSVPVADRRGALDPDRIKAAGLTWESVSAWLHGPMDAQAWSAVIPSMGYAALLRNLRNFDEAGVSDEVAEQVAARLADPEQVAKSRQFPFRFYAAYRATQSLRWGHALEKALKASLGNVPALTGRTLVLVDQSPSMFPGYYFSTPSKGDITNADRAKLFGAALALRADNATLAGYGTRNYAVPFGKGDAVLRLMEKFRMEDGTDTFQAVADHFAGHDRVVIVTDEQTQFGRYQSIDQVVPAHVPVYTWNIAGYGVGSTASGSGQRHTFAGLTDHAFRMIPLLESGRDGNWESIFRVGA